MTVTFKPAVRENVPLLIGLAGASGSGKTLSGLFLADGIAQAIAEHLRRPARIFGIDTERGRMLHYADYFEFLHGEIRPPFSPQAYGYAIDAAEEAGADIILADSFSHEWEGEGGVREWADRLEAGVPKPGVRDPKPWQAGDWIERPVKSPGNWTEPKLAHKRLVNKMLAARAHVIVCLRAEEKMLVELVDDPDKPGRKKTVITAAADRPLAERWVPICEKRFPYELTTSFLLTPNAPGVPIPLKLQKQHRSFFPDGAPITKEAGRLLGRWALGLDRRQPETRTAPQEQPRETQTPEPQGAASGEYDGA